MERARERRIKSAFFTFFDSPHPTLSHWRGIVVLCAELEVNARTARPMYAGQNSSPMNGEIK
jgi:hypothetical protein